MKSPWAYVLIGGVFETAWAVTIKLLDGFNAMEWLIPTIVFILCSTLLLNKGLSMGLPAGPSYSVWVGIGAIGSLVAGVTIFNDVMTAVKMLPIALILIGVVGIQHEQNKVLENDKSRSRTEGAS